MICRQCGHDLPEPAPMYCIYCGTPTGLDEPTGTAIPGDTMEKPQYYCPWEDREQLGFFPAYWETIKQVITNPIEFYQKLPPRGNLWSAVFYGVMTAWVGTILALLWQLPLNFAQFVLLADENPFFASMGIVAYIIFGLVFLIITPIFIFIWLFISAAITHFFLWIIGGAKHGYESTVRLICYAMTVNLAMIIPFCGYYIAGIWQFVLEIIGLKEVHETTYGKAIFAKIMPTIICCCCGILALLLFFGGLYQLMENPDQLREFLDKLGR